MSYCEDCGCKVYNGACTNCHEELYIFDQYVDLQGTEFELPFPDADSEFMQKVNEQSAEASRRIIKEHYI